MIELPRYFYQENWLFFLFFAAFALLCFIKYVYPIVFNRDFLMVITFGDTRVKLKEQKKWRTYDILVDILFSAVLGIIFALSLKSFGILEPKNISYFTAFATCCAGVFFVKYFLDSILFWIFNIHSEFENLYEKAVAFRLTSSIIVLPLVFAAYYSGLWKLMSSELFIGISFAVVLLIFIFFIGKFLISSKDNLLFFILYLCTAELLPLFVLYKLLKLGLTVL